MKKIVIALSTLGLFSLSYYLFHKNSRIDPYWGKSSDRTPASIIDQLSPEIDIYKDYFDYPTYQKRLAYDLGVNFRTDVDNEYLKRKTELAMHDAFRLTFDKMNSEKEKDPPLLSIFKEGLIESFTQHFIKTIGVLKLVNGTFQIDFNFVPRVQKDLNYNDELSSNQLVQWNNSGSLLNDLQTEDLTLQEKVLQTKLPKEDKPYQYQGGQITVWIKVVDMNATFKIPDPKKNAVKGFMRFRRYYKANSLAALKPFIERPDFKIEKTQVRLEKGKKELFVTVDVVKEFSLGSIVPKLDRIEVFFGSLQPDTFYRNTLIGNIFTNDDGKIKTGEFAIEGTFKAQNGQGYKFKTEIDRLVYDFTKKEFDRSHSRLKTTGNVPTEQANHMNLVSNQVGELLLKTHAQEFIEGLDLNEFHREMGGAR